MDTAESTIFFEWDNANSKNILVMTLNLLVWAMLMLSFLEFSLEIGNLCLYLVYFIAIGLFGYTLLREFRGSCCQMSISKNRIDYDLIVKNPYRSGNFIATTLNKFDASTLSKHRKVILKSDIKEIFIPLGRDRIIFRLNNKKKIIIELDTCSNQSIKNNILEHVELCYNVVDK